MQLLGGEALKAYSKFSDLNTTDNETIAETHKLDTFIFYSVENHTENDIIGYEKGVGKLIKEENDYFIDRVNPIVQGTTLDTATTATRPAEFVSEPENFLVVTTTGPSNFLEALFLPFSILASSESGSQLTQMSENTILGRLAGEIKALNQNDLSQILEGTSPKLIKLAPSSRPESPSRGTIFYNEETDNVEIYKNGTWEVLG